MKKYAKAFMAPALLTMIACEPIQIQHVQDKKQKNKVELPKEMSTKRFAFESNKEFNQRQVRMGEILAQSPIGFPHAANVFKGVLASDPNNDKALLYSAFLDIAMSYQGLVGKSEDLNENPEDALMLRKEIKKMGYPEITDFLLKFKGPKYQNYRDVQKDLLGKMQKSYKKALRKLERVQGDVELIITQMKTSNTEISYNCQNRQADGFEFTECQIKEEMNGISLLPAKIKTVDVEDVKVLKGSIKGILNYTRLLSAYSLEGQKALTEEIKDKELTSYELHQLVLEKYPNYLVLDSQNELGELRASLTEMVEIAMDLESLNNKFCDNELREMNLIQSICFDEKARAQMEDTLDMLAGPKEITLGYNAEQLPVTILMDLPGFLSNPLADLKSILGSFDYDDEGNGHIAREPQLNGLFPNGDYLEKLKQVVHEEEVE